MGSNSIKSKIEDMIYCIGDDPEREGLLETPARVVNSWREIYSGYNQDVEKVFTVFKEEDHQYNELVLLKGVEFYSVCEHHLLPFFGRAHIGYIPDGKIIGISKLARLLDIFSKRLQIQERIGLQITNALEDYLKPKGAVCILEAQHLCMLMRGVTKQNSIMVTSSLTGAFKEDAKARSEMLQLIKGV